MAPKAGPAPKIELGKAEQFTLENGLKVLVVENHKLPRVSFSIFVDTPPFMEREFAGTASISGELLKTGANNLAKSEIDAAIDFLGATLITSANGVYGSSLKKHQDELLEIMQNVLLYPTFSEEEFKKIKRRTISNLLQSKDDGEAIAQSVGQVLRYGKEHPYGEIETEETIENITIEKCKEYYNFYFKPNISYLTIVGDITPKEAKFLATQYFGGWKKGNVDKANFETPNKPNETLVDFVNKNGAVQSVINITYPVNLKPGDPDAIKASLANRMFGGFFSSRMNSNLREDKGYTYGANSSLNSDPYVGSFSAGASVRNEVTDSAIVEILAEIKKITTKEITDKEFDLLKNVTIGAFARNLENPQTIARFSRNIMRYNLPADYYKTYLEKVSQVTKKDILEMAQKYITPENAHILVVGNKDEVADKLGVFAKNGQVNFYDNEGNPITNDGAEIPVDVTAETILADYITAIGGEDRLRKVKSVKTEMMANMGGMAIQMTSFNQAPNQMCMEVAMNGNTMQRVVFDGEKGQIVAMGQAQDMPEEMESEIKAAGQIFPELFYKETGVKADLSGIEKINSKNAYKMIIELPTGKKKTVFFDMQTSLKIREVKTQMGNTETMDFAEYTEIEGIKFPYSQTITGSMPMPLKLEVKNIEVNKPIDAAIFKLN
jgi:predicted Zn-dependent peptidase